MAELFGPSIVRGNDSVKSKVDQVLTQMKVIMSRIFDDPVVLTLPVDRHYTNLRLAWPPTHVDVMVNSAKPLMILRRTLYGIYEIGLGLIN